MRRAARTGVPVLVPATLLATVLAGCSANGRGEAGASQPSTTSPATAASGPASTSVSSGPTVTSSDSTRRATSSTGIDATVPSRTISTAPAVALDSVAKASSSVTARIVSATTVRATGKGPGEVSGPAFRIAVEVSNRGRQALDLGSVSANLGDKRGVPAVQLTAERPNPFRGELAAGRSATGVFVFSKPKSFTEPATIALQLSSSLTIVQFTGRI